MIALIEALAPIVYLFLLVTIFSFVLNTLRHIINAYAIKRTIRINSDKFGSVSDWLKTLSKSELEELNFKNIRYDWFGNKSFYVKGLHISMIANSIFRQQSSFKEKKFEIIAEK